MTNIIITHILPTGTAFAVTKEKPVESIFIPGTVARGTGVVVGQEVSAILVPNAHQPERTPWLAARIDLLPPAGASLPDAPKPPEPPKLSIAERVHEVMQESGVWTVASMFEELFPGADKSAGIKEYNAISSAMRAMFARGDCAKFQLWRSPDQTKPGREWFTCYPEKADVDEWVEA